MAENIVRKIYLRSFAAVIAVAAITIMALAWLDITLLQALGFAALMLVYLVSQVVTLRRSMKAGNCTVVYATCLSKEDSYDIFGKKRRNMASYRFVASEKPEDETLLSDGCASFYIQGNKEMFVVGESYCLLFKRERGEESPDEERYSEHNLLGHEVMRAVPLGITYTDGEPVEETWSSNEDDGPILHSTEEPSMPNTDKIIVFRQREES